MFSSFISRFRLIRAGVSVSESRIVDARMGDWTVISVMGTMDETMLPDLQFLTERALSAQTHIVLDLNSVMQIDPAIATMLESLRKQAARVSRDIRIVGSAAAVRYALRLKRDTFAVYDCIADAVTATRDYGLEIQVYVGTEEAVIVCRGRGLAGLVPEIEAAFRGIPSPVREIDIDFRAVSEADAPFLTAVRDFCDYKREAGGRVRLAASQAVAKLSPRKGWAGHSS